MLPSIGKVPFQRFRNMVAIVEIRLSLVNSDYMTRSYNDMSRFALL